MNSYNKIKLIELLEKIKRTPLNLIILSELEKLSEEERKILSPLLTSLLNPPYIKAVDYKTHKMYFYDTFYTTVMNENVEIDDLIINIKSNPAAKIELINKLDNSSNLIHMLDKEELLSKFKTTPKNKLILKIWYNA